MHHPPRLDYCGLTVVLSNPSRFDIGTKQLLSATGGSLFDSSILPFNRFECDIRTLDECEKKPWLKDTKVILALGHDCVKLTGRTELLNELRGTPTKITQNNQTIYVIPSFLPQDSCDQQDLEARYNPLLQRSEDDESDVENNSEDANEDAKSTHGKTRRNNWKFWLEQDIRKAVRITRNNQLLYHDYHTFTTTIFPSIDHISDYLSRSRSDNKKYLFLDIETDSDYNISCCGLSFDDGEILVIPFIRYDYSRAYDNIGSVLYSIGWGIKNNIVVSHNGAAFDFPVLAIKYGLVVGRKCYDTMIAHHRLYPEVERSLGHCMSLYTDEEFHKNEGVFAPHNSSQEEQLWNYNTKDISGMIKVFHGIQNRARVFKAEKSIEQANDSIIPYLTTTLRGMRYNKFELDKMMTDYDRRRNQIHRMLRILTGISNLNPCSPKQVSAYLYDGLGLKRPQKDLTNEKTLLKHLIHKECPAINLIIEDRRISKLQGMLKFEPWIK